MKKQIKRKIYLLSKRQTMKPIEVIQYETGIQLIFEVQDIDLDTTATATMFVRKPSGKFVFQEDNIYLTGNTVTVDLHNQALAEHGHPFFQIKFKKDEEVISTYSGMLSVDKSLEDSGAEESKTVIAAFDTFTDEQIARIEEATQSQIDLMKAEVEAKGLSVLSTIPEDYTEMYNRVNTLYNSVANAIKGTVSGSVVRVDDVSPVEHKPVVRVHGKNLFDISKLSNIPGKLANNNDGTLTIEGNMYAVPTGIKIYELCPSLKAGDVCTLSFLSTSANTKYIWLNGANVMLYNGTYTFTDEMLNSELYLYGFRDTDEGYGSDCTISNIQIEEGETATEYTPYIDPTTVTVTADGVNYTPEADGTVVGIPSTALSGGISTDNEGITIECEYNKDTGKVIDNLTKAVVALGGVV